MTPPITLLFPLRVAARDFALTIDVAVHVDLATIQEQCQLLHRRMGHRPTGEAMGLVHDDGMDLLMVHAE